MMDMIVNPIFGAIALSLMPLIAVIKIACINLTGFSLIVFLLRKKNLSRSLFYTVITIFAVTYLDLVVVFGLFDQTMAYANKLYTRQSQNADGNAGSLSSAPSADINCRLTGFQSRYSDLDANGVSDSVKLKVGFFCRQPGYYLVDAYTSDHILSSPTSGFQGNKEKNFEMNLTPFTPQNAGRFSQLDFFLSVQPPEGSGFKKTIFSGRQDNFPSNGIDNVYDSRMTPLEFSPGNFQIILPKLTR